MKRRQQYKHFDLCSTEPRRNAYLQENGMDRKQRWPEGDHTTVTTEHFFLTGLAKTVTYTWNRACPREQGISPPQPSNSFALIPHFTTTQIASDSCWKSPVFLFGLTVPSARPAHKKELATLICKKIWPFQKNQYRYLQDHYKFPQAMALVHWPERKYLAPCSGPVDFKRNLIALFLQSKYRAITRGWLCSPLFWNLVSNICLQMPLAKGVWFSALLWERIPCFFQVICVFLILQIPYSNFVSFSTIVGQNIVNNLKFLFKKDAVVFSVHLCNIFSG